MTILQNLSGLITPSMVLFVLPKEVMLMSKITLRDIYWDKYGVGGMAMGDLIKAMQNGLPKENHKEFYEIALIRHTILTIEQILKEGNSISDIDMELPSCFN